jgi:glycosyltransferase involved in cell wall biosynthesis
MRLRAAGCFGEYPDRSVNSSERGRNPGESRRIVFLSWRDLAHPQAGGSEVLIDRLARACVARGHDVAVMSGSPTATRPYRVVALGGAYAQYARAPLAHARRFRDWDVLIDIDNGIPFFSPLWWRGPVVCLVHHLSGEQWHLRFPRPVATVGRALEERVMPRVYRAAPFICISASTASGVRSLGVPEEHIHVLPMGANAGFEPRDEPSQNPLFLSLGRLVPYKRIDLLLRIWDRVRPQVGGKLVIAGEGPERARLEGLATDSVEIRGRVSEEEKERLLGSAWLLVHSSLHEGWGIVISEAAHTGTPALAFDVRGVRDSVVQGETGLLVGSEREFADAWIELARDPERRRRMGAAARRHAESTPWEATVDAFLGVVEEAIQRKGRRPAPNQ